MNFRLEKYRTPILKLILEDPERFATGHKGGVAPTALYALITGQGWFDKNWFDFTHHKSPQVKILVDK